MRLVSTFQSKVGNWAMRRRCFGRCADCAAAQLLLVLAAGAGVDRLLLLIIITD